MTRYRVFYEDQAAGEVKEFGPHLLLCACVADKLETHDLWQLRDLLDGQPKKGDSKLLKACERHAARNLDEVVFAVFDADQIHELLRISKGSLADRQRALEERIGSEKIRPFLLDERIETVVKAVAECLEPPVAAPTHKRLLERDKLLARAARSNRSVRDCVLRTVPTFAAIVDAVAKALA